ncbi:hypothetical protein ES708_18845 [subsurface metagenome]
MWFYPLSVAGNRSATAGFPGDESIRETSVSILRPPSKNQDPYHLDYELPLDESRSLLFFTFNGTPIVQVVRREPQSKNPRTHEPSSFTPFRLLGLIARAMRAGYCVGSRQLLTFCGCGRYPARRLLLSHHRPSHIIRSKAHQTHLERTTWLIDRPTYRRLPEPEAP